MSEAQLRLCVCGESAAYPVCDASHKRARWSCGRVEDLSAALVISTGPALHHLAEMLAHKLKARVVTEHVSGRVGRLVRLCDLSDPYPTPHVSAERALNLAIDVPGALLRGRELGEAVCELSAGEPRQLYGSALKVIRDEGSWARVEGAQAVAGRRVFLSHAVADEGRLRPLVALLRAQYGLEVFVCGDSLSVGGEWYAEISGALSASDLVVQALTPSALTSTFCAFEAGFAVAARLPLLLISFERGARPPAHLQHLQAVELWRLQQGRPWLTLDELAAQVVLSRLLGEKKQA